MWCAVYSVQCTVYSVQCTVCRTHVSSARRCRTFLIPNVPSFHLLFPFIFVVPPLRLLLLRCSSSPYPSSSSFFSLRRYILRNFGDVIGTTAFSLLPQPLLQEVLFAASAVGVSLAKADAAAAADGVGGGGGNAAVPLRNEDDA